jgi:hypothetical protein
MTKRKAKLGGAQAGGRARRAGLQIYPRSIISSPTHKGIARVARTSSSLSVVAWLILVPKLPVVSSVERCLGTHYPEAPLRAREWTSPAPTHLTSAMLPLPHPPKQTAADHPPLPARARPTAAQIQSVCLRAAARGFPGSQAQLGNPLPRSSASCPRVDVVYSNPRHLRDTLPSSSTEAYGCGSPSPPRSR